MIRSARAPGRRVGTISQAWLHSSPSTNSRSRPAHARPHATYVSAAGGVRERRLPPAGVSPALCYLGWSRVSAPRPPLFVPFDPCEESPSCQPLTPLAVRRSFARLDKIPRRSRTSSTSSAARSSGSPTPRTVGCARRSTTSRPSRTTPATSPSTSASSRFDEPVAIDRGVSREGPHLRAPADRHGRVRQPRDR